MDSFDLEIFWGLLRTIIVLAVLAPAVYYFTRWYGMRRKHSATIQVKEAIPLGSNRGLYVVEWEGERFLLGVTNQEIRVLTKKAVPSDIERGEEA